MREKNKPETIFLSCVSTLPIFMLIYKNFSTHTKSRRCVAMQPTVCKTLNAIPKEMKEKYLRLFLFAQTFSDILVQSLLMIFCYVLLWKDSILAGWEDHAKAPTIQRQSVSSVWCVFVCFVCLFCDFLDFFFPDYVLGEHQWNIHFGYLG